MHKNVYVLLFLTLLKSSVSFGTEFPPIGLKDAFPTYGFSVKPSVSLMPPVMEECVSITLPSVK